MIQAQERTLTRELPVKLSEHELQLYGGFLAEKLRERDRIDDERKRVASEYKARIMKLDEEVAKLADARHKEEEIRAVLCRERWRNGTIEIVRTDTGEVVDARPATLADSQTSLPIDGSTDLSHLGDAPRNVIAMPPRSAPGIEEGEAEDTTVVEGLEVDVEANTHTSSVGDEVYVSPDSEEEGEVAVEPPDPDDPGNPDSPAFWKEFPDEEPAAHEDDRESPAAATTSEGELEEAELDQDELDEAHAARQEAAEEQRAATSGGAKAKRKKNGKKSRR